MKNLKNLKVKTIHLNRSIVNEIQFDNFVREFNEQESTKHEQVNFIRDYDVIYLGC
jgi:hypothetical protein